MAKTNEDDVSDSEDDVPLIQFLQPNQRLRTAEVRNGDAVVREVGERGRKRARNEANWYRNKRKILRNSGKTYETKTKKCVPAKCFNPDYNCGCRKQCMTKINFGDLSTFFESFWKLADYSKHIIFLRGLVKMSTVRRKRPRDGSGTNKSSSFEYTIPLKLRKTKKVLYKNSCVNASET
ncbi:uncharacterized protein isoform X2 [Leptinotarsa decemlineata]|uniref:uncharacterized protein isoform X2 n=1 Tax=Leptinotarsa decemlineata TaxID=7539 RepID=UPI003D30A469